MDSVNSPNHRQQASTVNSLELSQKHGETWVCQCVIDFKVFKHPLECIVLLAEVRFNFRYQSQQRGFCKGQIVYLCLMAKDWNILVKNCQSLPFLYASFRPVNTSIWQWESCLCSESAQIALLVSSRGNPVVWPLSQLFMCWGSWAEPLCQVLVLEESEKKLKVWFSLHDMCFSLRLHLKSFAVCSQGWTGLLACLAVMSPPPLLFAKQGWIWRAIKRGGDVKDTPVISS